MSYARESASPGRFSKSAAYSSVGAVNGWWIAVQPSLPSIEVDPLEHRSVHDPDELPRVVVDQAAALADLEPRGGQQTERVRSPACREEDAVAGFRPGLGRQARPLLLGQVLGDRAAELSVLLHQDVGEALGAARACPVLPGVELLAGLPGTAWHHDRADVMVVPAGWNTRNGVSAKYSVKSTSSQPKRRSGRSMP